MANPNYAIVTQYPGIDSLGGTQTQDVIFVGINARPGTAQETYVEFPVPTNQYPALVEATALGWAAIVQGIWSNEWVVGLQWTQLVNASNNLVTAWIIAVTSTTGNSTGTVTIENHALGPSTGGDKADALHDDLDSVEGQ
jgi:hypothetical protein